MFQQVMATFRQKSKNIIVALEYVLDGLGSQYLQFL
jgi:hypothetical protein